MLSVSEKVLQMNKEEIIKLGPGDTKGILNQMAISHILENAGALRQYNPKSAERGNPDPHFIFKSGKHGDLAFNFNAVKRYPNLVEVFAIQLCYYANRIHNLTPYCIIGVPNGPKELVEIMAKTLEVRNLKTEKINGAISIIDRPIPSERGLAVEDVLNEGTGLGELIRKTQQKVTFLPYLMTIVNRSHSKVIWISGKNFYIISLLHHPSNSYRPEECLPCKAGSPLIPKEEW